MISTMMDVPLSLKHVLDRAGTTFPGGQIVSCLPDKSLGLREGERVATLCWNHHAHLEACFGIPAAGGVMHTLNLRLSPEEIGWIAGNAEDGFLIVDDILLPLYRQFASLHVFETAIVFPFSGAPLANVGRRAAPGPTLTLGGRRRRRPGGPTSSTTRRC